MNNDIDFVPGSLPFRSISGIVLKNNISVFNLLQRRVYKWYQEIFETDLYLHDKPEILRFRFDALKTQPAKK